MDQTKIEIIDLTEKDVKEALKDYLLKKNIKITDKVHTFSIFDYESNKENGEFDSKKGKRIVRVRFNQKTDNKSTKFIGIQIETMDESINLE